MRSIKQLLRPERLRQIPPQFSWVDQALVQQHFIDRLHGHCSALYLFLVTVSDAQGLSYYGASTLARRLHLSEEQLTAARQQLIELDLIAYRCPLYQVLALPGSVAAPAALAAPARAAVSTGLSTAATTTAATTAGSRSSQPVSLATLLQLAQARRA